MSTSHTTTPTTPKCFGVRLLKQQQGRLPMLKKIPKLFNIFLQAIRAKSAPSKRVTPRTRRQKPYQKDIVLKHLILNGSATTSELGDLGIATKSISSAICEVKKMGWPIDKIIVKKLDHDGTSHRQAQYYIEEEKLTPEKIEFRKIVLAD